MEFVLFLSLFALMWSGQSFADESGSTLIKIPVKEGEDVILPCSLPQTDITREIFDWKKKDTETKEVFFYQRGSHYNNGLGNQDQQFRDRVFHFQDQLQFGNASIIIRTTQVADSGTYTCVFPSYQPKTRSQIELIVGAVSKHSVRTINQTTNWALLQCEVLGASPKPKVFWQDSTGNMIPAKEPHVKEKGGSYDIILQTTVTKSDTYRCVATQEEINHQVYEETYIGFGEFFNMMILLGVVGPIVGIGIGVVILLAVLKCKNIKLCQNDVRYTTGDQDETSTVKTNKI